VARPLLRVALRTEPSNLAAPSKPIVNVFLACQAFYVGGLHAGALGNNLPIALGDALWFEGDAGRFAYAAALCPIFCDEKEAWPANYEVTENGRKGPGF
jgi:hypothetical protein